jgi:FMN phosphatase YigB (HAD superfamily)
VNGENGATTALRVLEEQVMVPRLKEKYQTEVVPALMQEFKLRGLEVVIVTTAPDDEQGYALLKRLGMPFRD